MSADIIRFHRPGAQATSRTALHQGPRPYPAYDRRNARSPLRGLHNKVHAAIVLANRLDVPADAAEAIREGAAAAQAIANALSGVRIECDNSRPAATHDLAFRHIEEHKKAVAAYNLAVRADSVRKDWSSNSPDVNSTFDDMMMWSRCLIVGGASTRAGMIALTKYLAEQFDMEMDSGGCTSLPNDVGRRPWFKALLLTLAKNLRSMGSELPPAKTVKRRAPRDEDGEAHQ